VKGSHHTIEAVSLPLIHQLWHAHQHACPYVRHSLAGCYCTSPKLSAGSDPYMPCDTASVQLWCLTEEYYTKCCLWPAGDVP
jgi:hypothetical protein